MGRIVLRAVLDNQFPLFRRFQPHNYVGAYAYRTLGPCVRDLSIVTPDQITWNPYADFTHQPGFAAALDRSRTRRLFRHEYGLVFYLGERVMRQYSQIALRVPHPPPSLMRATSMIPAEERQMLLGPGVSFLELTSTTEDYAAFALTYLLSERRGHAAERYYARYARLGGDSRLIRGRTYIMTRCVAPDGLLIPRPVEDEFLHAFEDEYAEASDGEEVDIGGDGGGDDDGDAPGGQDLAGDAHPQQVDPFGGVQHTDSEAEAVEAEVDSGVSSDGEDSTERPSSSSGSDPEYVPSASEELQQFMSLYSPSQPVVVDHGLLSMWASWIYTYWRLLNFMCSPDPGSLSRFAEYESRLAAAEVPPAPVGGTQSLSRSQRTMSRSRQSAASVAGTRRRREETEGSGDSESVAQRPRTSQQDPPPPPPSAI